MTVFLTYELSLLILLLSLKLVITENPWHCINFTYFMTYESNEVKIFCEIKWCLGYFLEYFTRVWLVKDSDYSAIFW